MRKERHDEKGVRPSSFIAPVEKNVELSNGAAVVITIKTKRTREEGKMRTERKREARLFSFYISIFPHLLLSFSCSF